MRVDLKKYLFVGAEGDRTLFFRHAQKLGTIQFLDPKKNKSSVDQLPEVQELTKAIKILRGLPAIPQDLSQNYGNALALAQTIIAQNESLLHLHEQKRMMELEMARVAIFGNFSTEELQQVERQSNRKFQFFFAKHGHHDHDQLPPELIYVGSDHDLDYFVSISSKPEQYPKMVEMHIPRPIGLLKEEYKSLSNKIAEIEENVKTDAKYNTFLHHSLIHTLNEANLTQARDCVEFPLEQTGLFAVEGWVPVNKIDELNQMLTTRSVFAEELQQNPEEVAPTYLENEGISKIGEDILHIYDTPSNTDRDPSLWVLLFFSLFFAMIIGDGAYGVIFLLAALYMRYKYGTPSSSTSRFMTLVTILSFSVITWGFLTTSFFGIPISPNSPLRKVSLITWLVEKKADYHIQHQDEVYQTWVKQYPELASIKAPEAFLQQASIEDKFGNISYPAFNDFADSIMLELALFIGVLHILLSMGRYLDKNPQNLGWMIFIVGAYLYIPTYLGATSILNFAFGIHFDGKYLLYIGFSLAVLIALYKHKLLGLLEATVVIQILADVLSYLRLYALGLAGSLMSSTIWEIATSMPLIIGIIIFILGHSVNIVLNIMGGVIHGLRLNFLEWYHYSFEGGGKPFTPLKKQIIEEKTS